MASAGQGGPVQAGPVQGGLVQDGPVQDGSVPDGTVQGGTVQGWTKLGGLVQSGSVPNWTKQTNGVNNQQTTNQCCTSETISAKHTHEDHSEQTSKHFKQDLVGNNTINHVEQPSGNITDL